MGSKGGGKPDTSAQNAQAALAQEMFKQISPLRESLIGRSQSFLEGGLNPAASPLFAPTKASFDQQFKRAKENLIAGTPSGGAMTSALGNMEGQKATGLAAALGGISGQELQNALGLVGAQTSTAGNMLGSAAASQAAQAQAYASQKGSKGQALGMLGGGALGGFLGGPKGAKAGAAGGGAVGEKL